MDPGAHGLVVRYFTDEVTEMDLANSLNEDGSVKLNADGYPLSTRTDVLMSIYDTPAPSQEEIEKRIMLNAPVDWLKLQEDIQNPNVDTKLANFRNLTGESKAFTIDKLLELRGAIVAIPEDTQQQPEQDSVQKSYDIVANLIDSLRVLVDNDPDFIKEFAKTMKEVINKN